MWERGRDQIVFWKLFHFKRDECQAYELLLEHSWDVDAILSHAAAVTKLKDAIFKKAKKNIDHAQDKDKMYYDQKHADKRVSEVLTVAIYSILGIANTSVYLIDFLSTLIT